jgi:hypothetical protein
LSCFLRRSALALVLAVALLTALIGAGVAPAAAAEVLQVRSASLLLVGDSNRTYTVELACISSSPEQQPLALDWLRGQLPRRSRVNLRPLGNRDGVLVARVQKLSSASDLSSAMVEAGLAEPGAAPGCA